MIVNPNSCHARRSRGGTRSYELGGEGPEYEPPLAPPPPSPPALDPPHTPPHLGYACYKRLPVCRHIFFILATTIVVAPLA